MDLRVSSRSAGLISDSPNCRLHLVSCQKVVAMGVPSFKKAVMLRRDLIDLELTILVGVQLTQSSHQ